MTLTLFEPWIREALFHIGEPRATRLGKPRRDVAKVFVDAWSDVERRFVFGNLVERSHESRHRIQLGWMRRVRRRPDDSQSLPERALLCNANAIIRQLAVVHFIGAPFGHQKFHIAQQIGVALNEDNRTTTSM